MTYFQKFLKTPPHVQLRKDRYYFFKYDGIWLLILTSAMLARRFFEINRVYETWTWDALYWLPLAAVLSIYANVITHTTTHYSLPDSINRVVGEILGLVVLSRFASWQVIHAIHHQYSDDVERDPHAVQPGFWRNVFHTIFNVEATLQKNFTRIYGDTKANRRFEAMRSVVSFSTMLFVLFTVYDFTGASGLALIYGPATAMSWIFICHFNWVTHNALDTKTDFHPVNLTRARYRFLNHVFVGIYDHATHHRYPKIFNPSRFNAKKRAIAAIKEADKNLSKTACSKEAVNSL